MDSARICGGQHEIASNQFGILQKIDLLENRRLVTLWGDFF